ncbi:hotdog fold thioesterase [Desulfovibrio aminophilus]|uniref:PaaI family thioesterase n=1 Tax=Desulfovibrio aminophilus TaxID=81425 RepID=UPI0033933A36
MNDPAAYLEAVSRPGQSVNNLFNFLGIEVVGMDDEKTVLRLTPRAETLQGGNVLAGGIMATLLDETMAHAVLRTLKPGQTTATVEMSTRFFNPVTASAVDGPPLVCEAQVVRKGQRIAFAEAEIRDHQGSTVARCSACFVIR